MSDSWRPHGLQPTRLLRPRDSPCKSTGVGCYLPYPQLLTNNIYVSLCCIIRVFYYLLYTQQLYILCPTPLPTDNQYEQLVFISLLSFIFASLHYFLNSTCDIITVYVFELFHLSCFLKQKQFSKCGIPGLPSWFSGKESAYQCRRQGFDPWSGTDPTSHGVTWPCVTTSEAGPPQQKKPPQ